MPDAQPLGHHSSPWGPQTPWDSDAYNFLAEVCGIDGVCGSASGFGCGSGCDSFDEPFDLCSSSDEAVAAPDDVAEAAPDDVFDLCSSSDEAAATPDNVFSQASSVDSWYDNVVDGHVVDGEAEVAQEDVFHDTESSDDEPPCRRPYPPLNSFHQFYCLLLSVPYDAAIQFERACMDHLCVLRDNVPWGGVLPFGPGPLPLSPGGFLTVACDAHAVWTAAPWSAAVLARWNLAGTSQLAELKLASCQCVTGWMHLSPNQVAYRLLVTWKVWFWPDWSVLPYPEFVVLDDDPHSFDQYSVPPLQHDQQHNPVWYSAWFASHVHAVAGAACYVPCLYSLAM